MKLKAEARRGAEGDVLVELEHKWAPSVTRAGGHFAPNDHHERHNDCQCSVQ